MRNNCPLIVANRAPKRVSAAPSWLSLIAVGLFWLGLGPADASPTYDLSNLSVCKSHPQVTVDNWFVSPVSPGVYETGWLVPAFADAEEPYRGLRIGDLQVGPGTHALFIDYMNSSAAQQATDRTYAATAIQKYLVDAARFYNRMGLNPPEANCVMDPNPEYVANLAVLDPDTLGEYSAPCISGEQNDRLIQLDEPGLLPTFAAVGRADANQGAPPKKPAPDVLITPAHELFHAVQYASDMARDHCDEISSWNDEGLADAFGYLWLENAAPRYASIKNLWRRTNRDYTMPLHLPFGHSLSDEEEEKVDTEAYYGTWWFWRYVMDQYDKNPMENRVKAKDRTQYYAQFYNDFVNYERYPIAGCSEKPDFSDPDLWEVDWLDKVLKCWNNNIHDTERPVKGGLYVMYPNFAAWMVQYLAESDKLGKSYTAFGNNTVSKGCYIVQLQEYETFTLSVSIRELGSVCVEVKLQPNKLVKTFAVSIEHPFGILDNIHLGYGERTLEPMRMGEQGDWKAWMVYVNDDAAQVYLSLSNVAPVAKTTQEATNLTFQFDYASSGLIQ